MSDFSVKAVINRQNNKVLFVEVENEFANVLVGFMTLPLGRIVQLLRNHYGDQTPVIGSLNTLYDGVANLDCSHFKSYHEKETLLDQESANSSLFKDNFFEYAAASFIVSDDLWMMPNVNRSLVQSLDYIGVFMPDMDGADTRILTFGVNEIMDLLKGLFISHHPLTDVILGTKWVDSTPDPGSKSTTLSHVLIKNYPTPHDSDEVVLLNLMFQKSTGKLLFAQAGQDFVDILFSMLKIPLGAVVWSSGTSVVNINNLYQSISDMHGERFNDPDTRGWLLGYINPDKAQSLLTSQGVEKPIFVDSRSRMYIVFDDLTVTPFSVCSTLSLLSHMEISASDVQELQLNLGIEECPSILNASLTSAHAITEGIATILLGRQLERIDRRSRHA